MNILIIPSWYNSKEKPLNGIFFKEQAMALKNYFQKKNTNDKVFILYLERFSILDLKKYIKNFKTKISIEDNIPTLRASFLGIPKFEKIDFSFGAKKLNTCINKMQKLNGVKFDLVHIHSALDAGIWYSLSKQKIPYVITEHSSKYSRKLISNQKKMYLSKVFDNAHDVFAVGIGLAHEVKQYTINVVKVLFNIVNSSFSYNKKILKSSNVITFFSLGMNAMVKGHDILLLAFQNYILKGHQGKLIIAGLNEEEKKWLLTLGVKQCVLKHVTFLGKLDRNTVFQYMYDCDCFSLVSRFETFGVVFAEAMYCGKPVIATRTGGPDSFVTAENGILVDVEDVEQTTNALIKMSENIEKYDSNKICKYAVYNFSSDVICEKLYNIYKDVIV